MTSLTLSRLAWTPLGHGHCHHQFQLRDATLQVGAGAFVGLIGPNGSGKTSLLRCAYRFSQPEAGAVKLDHHNVWKQSSRWCEIGRAHVSTAITNAQLVRRLLVKTKKAQQN